VLLNNKMTLELILWIVAGLVVMEIIFIIGYRHICKRKEDFFSGNLFHEGDWIGVKLLSFLIAGAFIKVQAIIVFGATATGFNGVSHYEYLLYELLIIIVIGIFFLINKLIANRIEDK